MKQIGIALLLAVGVCGLLRADPKKEPPKRETQTQPLTLLVALRPGEKKSIDFLQTGGRNRTTFYRLEGGKKSKGKLDSTTEKLDFGDGVTLDVAVYPLAKGVKLRWGRYGQPGETQGQLVVEVAKDAQPSGTEILIEVKPFGIALPGKELPTLVGKVRIEVTSNKASKP